MPFSKEILAGSSGQAGFYNNAVRQSLRFNMGSSHYLADVPADGNRRKFTIAFWIKRSELDENNVGGSNDTPIFSGTDDDGSNISVLRFLSQLTSGNNVKNMLQLYTSTTGVADYSEEVIISFRDTAAWFHVVMAVDTEQSTASNRVKFYVNGELQTAVGQHYAQVPEDYDTHFNQNNSGSGKHNIGRNLNSTGRIFDGYLADFNFVDGAQLTPSSFAEEKEGIWIPKAPTVSDYGTNGFRMEFKQTGTDQNSSGIGADTSGKGNHYSVGNLSAHDSNFPDCPELNFATMSRLSFQLAPDNIAEGNLRVGQTDQMVMASDFGIPSSGKWYWEINSVSSNGSNYYFPYSGVCTEEFFHSKQSVNSSAGNTLYNAAGVSHMRGNDAKYKNITATSTANGTNTATEGQAGTEQGVLGLALNNDDGEIKYYWNGSLIRTDTTLSTGVVHFPITIATNSGSNIWNYNYYNFGQDGTFAGTKTAGNNSDANGRGNFLYSVPSGHLALCSANLPDTIFSPDEDEQANDHMNTVLYDGNGANSHAITGVGFQPDWLWIKRLDGTNSHVIMDSSRGSGSNDSLRVLISNVSDAEYDLNDHVRSLDADGFTLDDDTDNTVATNNSTENYVAWSWKFNGGTTATDANGTITSTVQANTNAGQSVVLWSGNETNSARVGHGLSSAPEVIITKCRSHAASWVFGIGGMSQFSTNDYLSLNSTNAKASSTTFYQSYTSDSNKTFTVGVSSADEMNRNTGGTARTYVSYCFHSVEGYSKFGAYTGNGSDDGPFIFLGFRPQWIMIKNTTSTLNWSMYDDTRFGLGTIYRPNPIISHLAANNGNAEFDSRSYQVMDFLSNGFKIRLGGTGSTLAQNVNKNTSDIFFYMAFAETPYKFANAMGPLTDDRE